MLAGSLVLAHLDIDVESELSQGAWLLVPDQDSITLILQDLLNVRRSVTIVCIPALWLRTESQAAIRATQACSLVVKACMGQKNLILWTWAWKLVLLEYSFVPIF